MRLIDGDTLRERLQNLAYDDWNQGIATSFADACNEIINIVEEQPTIKPERKRGKWILDRSGAYCCSECMEPCSSYILMKPRDKFCKMCGVKMEVMG